MPTDAVPTDAVPTDAVPTHAPVLRERVVALLAPALAAPGAVLVDATVGLGGHAAALLAVLPEARLVGLDRDRQALEVARERLEPYASRTTLVPAVYDELPAVLARLGTPRVNGVLFDLGVSSMHLDDPARGFAYAEDVALDMRMDQSSGRTAADILNTYSVDELTRVLREYGEERFARGIAAAIVRARRHDPFTTSDRLVDVVRRAIPARARRVGGHPAKRTFQALRIEVNQELDVLTRALPAAIDALVVAGRVVVLAYHSLEDRLVKRTLVARARVVTPPGLPVLAPGEPELRLLTRGPERPSAEEVADNPRAASARLRAAERVREAA